MKKQCISKNTTTTRSSSHSILPILRDEQGAIAIMFVVLLNVMLGLVALAIDGGYGMAAKTIVAAATDPAALAGAVSGGDKSEVEKYFRANLEPGMYGISYNYQQNVHVSISSGQVTVEPTGFTIPTFFAGSLSTSAKTASNTGGSKELHVGGAATVSMQTAEVLAADIVFVLDASGSMQGSNVEALRTAVYNGLDMIENSNNQNPDEPIFVSLTSYATKVRVAPSVFTDNIMSVRNMVHQATLPKGSTCGSCSLKLIPDILPSKFNDIAAIILFTDGNFNKTTTGPGSNAHGQVRYWCDQIKAYGNGNETVIYTIGYGAGAGQSAATLRYCATSPNHYFTANNASALNNIYSSIISELGKLRIVR